MTIATTLNRISVVCQYWLAALVITGILGLINPFAPAVLASGGAALAGIVYYAGFALLRNAVTDGRSRTP